MNQQRKKERKQRRQTRQKEKKKIRTKKKEYQGKNNENWRPVARMAVQLALLVAFHVFTTTGVNKKKYRFSGVLSKGDTFSQILEISITTGEYYCIFKI